MPLLDLAEFLPLSSIAIESHGSSVLPLLATKIHHHTASPGKRESLEHRLEQYFHQPTPAPAQTNSVLKIQAVCAPCLFAILLLGSARDVFHDRVKAIYRNWIDAIAHLLIECGMNEEFAQQRAQDAVTAIQGSLIISQGLDDPSGFVRLMQHKPRTTVQKYVALALKL